MKVTDQIVPEVKTVRFDMLSMGECFRTVATSGHVGTETFFKAYAPPLCGNTLKKLAVNLKDGTYMEPGDSMPVVRVEAEVVVKKILG